MNDEIKRAISVRILLSILILVFFGIGIGFLNVVGSFKQVEKTIDTQCTILSRFAASQLLAGDDKAVENNLQKINRHDKLMHFRWYKKGEAPKPDGKMDWRFPFSWVDYCAIKTDDGKKFGYFKVSGSLIYNYELLSNMLMKFSLFCFFIFLIFLLLCPLGKRIPQQIFVKPILELVNLLKPGWKDASSLEETVLPMEIQHIKSKLIQLLAEAEKSSHEAAFAEIAAKVAHDIRSPLAALNILLAKNSAILPPQERNIMKGAIDRINAIASNLLDSRRDANLRQPTEALKTKPELGAVLMKNIVSEKQTQYGERDIKFKLNISEEAAQAFIDVNASEITRALSNLINNAVEAIEQKGIITLNLLEQDKNLVFAIQDTGKGMQPEQLLEVLQKSISVGKEHGSGIGLSSARQTIESLGGTFTIESVFEKGTTVQFTLPIVPARFVCDNPDFIFIDDSIFLTDAWQAQAQLNHQKLVVFNTIEDVQRYIHLFEGKTPIYIDSDLGGMMKGEYLAKTLYERGFSTIYLCTGREEIDFPPMPWIKKIVGKEYPKLF